MKRKYLILVFILLAALTATTCKKKYPKDIPIWLKEKIDALEKDSKGKGCKSEACRIITEHSDGSSTFYYFKQGVNPSYYYIYNYPGSLICEYETTDGSTCHFQYSGLKKIRNIWIED